jgi:hypothetical protein
VGPAAKAVAVERADRSCMRQRWPIIWSTENSFSPHLEGLGVPAAVPDREGQVAREVLREVAAIVEAVEILAQPGLSATVETKERSAFPVRMEMCAVFERELRTLGV